MSYLDHYKDIILRALEEDIGKGDITTDNIGIGDQPARAVVISKDEGILCGVDVASHIYYLLDKNIMFKKVKADGKKIKRGDIVAEIAGPASSILKGERTALNFLGTLSGIATITQKYVKIAKKKKIKIYDTRKTTPCLRVLEKYAVKIGGGENHRFGLYDQVLIKENHIKLIARKIDIKKPGECEVFINNLRKKVKPALKIEVEADTLELAEEISKCKVDIIMLDNFKPVEVIKAVRMIRKNNRNMEIEVSGNIDLKNIRSYLIKGINRISIGKITHSVQSIDFSLIIL